MRLLPDQYRSVQAELAQCTYEAWIQVLWPIVLRCCNPFAVKHYLHCTKLCAKCSDIAEGSTFDSSMTEVSPTASQYFLFAFLAHFSFVTYLVDCYVYAIVSVCGLSGPLTHTLAVLVYLVHAL